MTFKAPTSAARKQDQVINLAADPANAKMLADLMTILSWSRPAGSATDDLFVTKFLDTIPGMHADEYGNRWLQVGKEPEIMWSCHTDTVDRREGAKTLKIHNGFISLDKGSAKVGTCLGADDGAGLWLMLEMIKAGVGGLYAFHRDEEIGGIGSRWAAKNVPHYMLGIKAAIAFDRKGYTDVITHQGHRTCSDVFADSLGSILGMGFKKDDTGLFTDTANYTDLIGECTNLSIGYFGNHGPAEQLDAEFLLLLRKAVIEGDFTQLVYSRAAGEEDPDDYMSAWKEYRSAYGFDDAGSHDYKYDQKGNTLGRKTNKRHQRSAEITALLDTRDRDCFDDRGTDPWADDGYDTDTKSLSQNVGYQHFGNTEMLSFVKNNPGLLADFLEFNGFSIDDVCDFAEDVFDPTYEVGRRH